MSLAFPRVFLIVLDGVGIGELPDAFRYGDAGANTLKHIAEAAGPLSVPNLERLGLGRIGSIRGVSPNVPPMAYYGKMAAISTGKDTLSGHWEIAGVRINSPFRTFPLGFPDELVTRLTSAAGRKFIGNRAASGTDIVAKLGERHMHSGELILYTSSDSVLQIAAHEEIVPHGELYEICRKARMIAAEDRYYVGRVIARPFTGRPGAFAFTAERRDYAVKPPYDTVLTHLVSAGYESIGIGNISDLFAGEGVTRSIKTKSNEDGLDRLAEEMKREFTGLCFVNLADFDALYGHRRDPKGYAAALKQFDARLPEIVEGLRSGDLLIMTADHGNDPLHYGRDHTREYVPLLVARKGLEEGLNLGVRTTFADVGATIADNFHVRPPRHGESFLHKLFLGSRRTM